MVEEASVHESDWPYERSPLASQCGDGLGADRGRGARRGRVVLAALGHAGGQGSSAYHQRPLWAPSRVPEVNTREVPKWMEADDIDAVVAGFGGAAKLALEAGCDGVEVNAGQHSLVRQFLSGLTNQRGDEWGTDRLRFANDVLATVRGAIGPDAVLGLRLCCDELAPWAGITPSEAENVAAALAAHVDYLVVVRGSIFSVEKTRPDFHEPAGFNVDLCRVIRTVVPADVRVVLQGSVVDAGQAEWAVGDGVADVVEMTRAMLADPDLARKLDAGADPAAVHPLQPDVPGPRRPQPHRDVRRGAHDRARDRGPGLVPAGRAAPRRAGGGRRTGWAGVRPGGRPARPHRASRRAVRSARRRGGRGRTGPAAGGLAGGSVPTPPG